MVSKEEKKRRAALIQAKVAEDGDVEIGKEEKKVLIWVVRIGLILAIAVIMYTEPSVDGPKSVMAQSNSGTEVNALPEVAPPEVDALPEASALPEVDALSKEPSVNRPETATAQSNTSTGVDQKALHPTKISTDVSSGSLFIHFDSKHGFIYETIGLPLIGEHYPFLKVKPDKIFGPKHGPSESVDSMIIPKYSTENAGYKTFHGISLLSGKLIWLGIAVLFGFIAVLSKNIIAAFIGGNHPALNNLFLYGFGVGFFLSILFIDDINDSFGKNRLVYFDNANSSPYRVIVAKHDAVEIGARKNIGAYLGLGWNDLEVHPAKGSGDAWLGKIYIEKSDGYLVFNIDNKNQYNVETAVWKK